MGAAGPRPQCRRHGIKAAPPRPQHWASLPPCLGCGAEAARPSPGVQGPISSSQAVVLGPQCRSRWAKAAVLRMWYRGRGIEAAVSRPRYRGRGAKVSGPLGRGCGIKATVSMPQYRGRGIEATASASFDHVGIPVIARDVTPRPRLPLPDAVGGYPNGGRVFRIDLHTDYFSCETP